MAQCICCRNVVWHCFIHTQYFYTLMLILDGICQIIESEIRIFPKSFYLPDALIRLLKIQVVLIAKNLQIKL